MLRVFIVDDEPTARKRLKKLLAGVSMEIELEVIGEATDGVDAVENLNREPVDIVFLDIQMPGLDGFEVLDRLDPESRPVVIFTTAFDEYALRAFDANAVDYLLKPITIERLSIAIKRAKKILEVPGSKRSAEDDLARLLDWMDANSGAGPAPTGETSTDKPDGTSRASYLKQLSIPYRDRILIVPITRLVSIEIAEGITRVYIVDDEDNGPRPRLKQHIVNYTLDQIGEMLDPDHFMRVHRSVIVQFSHIRELISWFSGRYKLVLTGNHEVIASRERSKILKERLRI
jgi:two-component system LytT family response regulator